MAGDALIGLAMSAIFNLCAPMATDAVPHQKFSPDLVELNEAEREGQGLAGGGRFWRINSDVGPLFLNVEDSYCRIINLSVDPKAAEAALREQLRSRGVTEEMIDVPDGEGMSGLIPVTATESVAIVLSFLTKPGARGFYAIIFLVKKRTP